MAKREDGEDDWGMDERVTIADAPRTKDQVMQENVSVTELAGMCGCTEQTIRQWRKMGRIPEGRKWGNQTIWTRAEANDVVQSGPKSIGTYTKHPQKRAGTKPRKGK